MGPGASEAAGAVELVAQTELGKRTKWQLTSITPLIPIGATAYAGGGGTVSGALPHACEAPEGFTVVSSLEEMIQAMGQSNVRVALAPGTYALGPDDADIFTEQTMPDGDSLAVLLPVSGSNSEYDFRCTRVDLDTALYQLVVNTVELRTVGNESVIRHLTIEGLGETAPRSGIQSVIMDGRDNTIEGLALTSRGSSPYGLGDSYGKGGGPILSHDKHSAVLLRGWRNTFRHSSVFHYAYGHYVVLQGSQDTLIDGIYVQGELRSTAEMLAAHDPRFAEADARAQSVDFITEWGYRLPTGYWMSLGEGGVRAYNTGKTEVEGVLYENAATGVTLLNSVIRHSRSCVALAHASEDKLVDNVTCLENENGFGVDNGTIVNSYADANVGPVLGFAYSNDANVVADITVLPTNGERNGSDVLAHVGGKNQKVTLRATGNSLASDLIIRVGGKIPGLRYHEDLEENFLTLSGSEVNNMTNYPLVISDMATGTTGQSDGLISGNTAANSITQN